MDVSSNEMVALNKVQCGLLISDLACVFWLFAFRLHQLNVDKTHSLSPFTNHKSDLQHTRTHRPRSTPHAAPSEAMRAGCHSPRVS